MTAGRDITHSERFEEARREGGRMNGIQARVALHAEPGDDLHVSFRPEDIARGEAFYNYERACISACLASGSCKQRRSSGRMAEEKRWLIVACHSGVSS